MQQYLYAWFVYKKTYNDFNVVKKTTWNRSPNGNVCETFKKEYQKLNLLKMTMNGVIASLKQLKFKSH